MMEREQATAKVGSSRLDVVHGHYNLYQTKGARGLQQPLRAMALWAMAKKGGMTCNGSERGPAGAEYET